MQHLLSLLNLMKIRSYTRWIIFIIVFFQSLLMWLRKREFRKFDDCWFYNWKQAKHPIIGDRSVEYPWVYQRVRDLSGCIILDVGAKEGLAITDILVQRNAVYAIDQNVSTSYKKGKISIIRGDIRSPGFDREFFDAVVAVSVLEHIGIPGRYNITQLDEDGDLKAMEEIWHILKPGGRCIITVPYGCGRSLPLNRLYDAMRIRQLCCNFEITECQYFKFHEEYQLWLEVSEDVAAATDWDTEPWYAIVCLVLLKAVEITPDGMPIRKSGNL